MFIFSQDKKSILEVANIQVSKNYGGRKGEKFCIVGISKSTSVLGKYPTEEAALIEMEHIFTAMKNNETAYALR